MSIGGETESPVVEILLAASVTVTTLASCHSGLATYTLRWRLLSNPKYNPPTLSLGSPLGRIIDRLSSAYTVPVSDRLGWAWARRSGVVSDPAHSSPRYHKVQLIRVPPVYTFPSL